eukprot:703053-Amorphochlora_amoeboformis.AAC.1
MDEHEMKSSIIRSSCRYHSAKAPKEREHAWESQGLDYTPCHSLARGPLTPPHCGAMVLFGIAAYRGLRLGLGLWSGLGLGLGLG